MSKELEDLYCGEEVKTKYGVCYAYSPDVVEEFRQDLNRLESIDNANPSEALECLEKLSKSMPQYDSWIKYIDTIKQALLKAQEPKHYLKWEDLEFKEEEQTMKVKLNNKIYTMFYCSDEVCFDTVSIAGVFIDSCSQQFFNDLHLERVEE